MIFYLIQENYNPEYYIKTEPYVTDDILISISMIKIKSIELNLWHRSTEYTDKNPVYYMNKHEFNKIYGE